MNFEQKKIEKQKEELFDMPESIDKKGTLFSYGFLLDKKNLENLLKVRGKVNIFETNNLEEAERLSKNDSKAIIILSGVTLEGVRVSIINEGQLRDLFAQNIDPEQMQIIMNKATKKQQEQIMEIFTNEDKNLLFEDKAKLNKGDLQKKENLIRKWYMQYLRVVREITQEDIPDVPRKNAYLYAEKVEENEKPRFLQGGLLIGLEDEEMVLLADYEFWPVYEASKIQKLSIGDKQYITKNISFFEGKAGNPHTPQTKEKTREILEINRSIGNRPQAKWPKNVRNL